MPLPLWSQLLRVRQEVAWGNFTWFSPKTLLLSINDQISKTIEEPDDSGSIVDRRRMRWVAAQRDRVGHLADPDVPLRIPDSSGFLALGDPGEMDASQYVLVRDLVDLTTDLQGDGIATALLMSDVVYPAGNINDWADAVYLPYLGLPRESWDNAVAEWSKDEQWSNDPSDAARTPDSPAGTAPLRPPLQGWNVLAMPGNHDWYDGLNGFMYHACGAEPLAEVRYNEQGFTWRQRLARSWWRNPNPPRRELLHQLRGELDVQPKPGIPQLPGPYYLVDFGCREAAMNPRAAHPHSTECTPTFRLIVVDNGITGTIDIEQADWFVRALETDLPKVVVTGSPLLVNNRIQAPRVAEVHPAGSTERGQRDLFTLMTGKAGVVATMAGDIHNYQRLTLPADAAPGTPPLQIVAGGAGAFLSATHPIRFGHDDELELVASRQTEGADGVSRTHRVTLPQPNHRHFPSREQSVLHYYRVLRDYLRSLLALTLVSLGCLVGLFLAARATGTGPITLPFADNGSGVVERQLLLTTPWLLAVVGVPIIAFTLARVARQGRGWPRRLTAASGLSALIGLAVLLGTSLGGATLIASVAAALYVVLLVVAQVIPPLVESFPELRRSWVARTGAVALLGLYLRTGQHRLAVALGAAIGTVAYVLAKVAYREWADRRTRESLVDPRRTSGRTLTVVVRWVPFIGAALLIGAVTVIWPVRILREFGVDQAEPIGAVARALSIGTLGVSTAVIVAVALWPLRSAWHTLTRVQAAVIGVCTVAGVLSLWLPDWGTAFGTAWPARVLLVALVTLAAVLGAAVGVLIVLARALVRPPAPPATGDVTWALRRRDGHDPTKAPSGSRNALFGAMMIAGIPGLESLAEAARPPFGKNVMVVKHHPDGDGPGVIEFQAWGLDDESPRPGDPARARTGFFPIESCRVDPTTMQVSVDPPGAEAITP